MTSTTPAKIAVLQYSTYGHIATLAEQIAEGVKSTGASVEVFQFEETLSEEVLGKMHANKAPISKFPVITPAKLAEVSWRWKEGKRDTNYVICLMKIFLPPGISCMHSPLSWHNSFWCFDQFDGFLLGFPTRWDSDWTSLQDWIELTVAILRGVGCWHPPFIPSQQIWKSSSSSEHLLRSNWRSLGSRKASRQVRRSFHVSLFEDDREFSPFSKLLTPFILLSLSSQLLWYSTRRYWDYHLDHSSIFGSSWVIRSDNPSPPLLFVGRSPRLITSLRSLFCLLFSDH